MFAQKKNMKRYFLLILSGFTIVISCKDKSNTSSNALGDILNAHIDSTVHPGDDFFEYANGGWLKKNPIPPSETGWGIWNLVDEENYTRLRKISEDASAQKAPKGSAEQLIGDFFFSGMDSASIEKQGIEPLKPYLSQIDAIKNPNDLVNVISMMQQLGAGPLYSMYVSQDMKNSEKNMLYLTQGGLGLPDRDYYFNTDSRTVGLRDEYKKTVAKIFSLLGHDSVRAKNAANAVYNLEEKLAKSHKKLEDLRDPHANYNKMSLSALQSKNPNLAWTSSFSSLKLNVDSVIVGQPLFFQTANDLVKSQALSDWKNYLTWHLVSSVASQLPNAFDKSIFNFYGKSLKGSKERRARWKRVLNEQERALGDALGQLFVKQYVPERTKLRYEELTERIVESYAEHIQRLDWMSDSTKQKALSKLKAITKKVAYPSKWKDYSNMSITPQSYCTNVLEGRKWHFNYEANKLGKPVDRTEWGMTPQTYNAYYNPSNNEIVLPAAIFTTPGYLDSEVDDAVIYGYVGASTIGHELTHGFDDEGRQFDARGNLMNWWSKEDEQKFKTRADLLVTQFNNYVVLDSLHPNGRASLGENIADLGGLVIGLDAFKKTKQYQEGKLIGGLTPLQRYFLGYAYGWMQTRTKEMLASQLLTDVHAPIFLRVNGPMSNCDDWYKAFNVGPNHKMYRDSLSRVRIW